MVATSVRTNALDSFGTKSPSKKDPVKALRAAGALFDLKKVSLAEFAGVKANSDLHVVVRTDTEQAIGQVGNTYECFSNEQFFCPTAEALIEIGAEIERVQILDQGTRSFMRMSWPDDMNLTIGRSKVGDIVGRRCTLSTSHDGKWAGKLTLQMLRLVCSNGMTVPVGKFDIALTHTVGGRQQLIDLPKLIPAIDRYVRQFDVAANILAQTPVADDKALDIITRIVDPTGKAGEKKSGGPNRAQNRISHIVGLFDGGQPGADTPECKGTGWGLYNAAVDYFTHEKGTRGEDERVQRFKSLLPGGPAQKEIVRAWDIVTDGLDISSQMRREVAAVN